MSKRDQGILICFLIAILAWYLGTLIPLVGGPVFGILLGMVIALGFSDSVTKIKEGATFSGKKILQFSVILLGFEMNIFRVLEVGRESLYVMAFTLTSAFLAAWFFGKLLKIDRITGILIGVGTSICGGSAIAATAPVVNANDKEVAHSISTIFLFNIAAVFVFPFLGHLFQMSDTGFGIWAGTAVNDTSSVLATSYSFSNESGKLATIVKLTRTLMIIPITFVLSIYISRQNSDGVESKFSLAKAFPYFVVGFVLTAILNTTGFLPPILSQGLATLGKFFIVVAMVGIGLNTHLGQLIRNGFRPILLGFCCWVTLAVTSLVVQNFLGLL